MRSTLAPTAQPNKYTTCRGTYIRACSPSDGWLASLRHNIITLKSKELPDRHGKWGRGWRDIDDIIEQFAKSWAPQVFDIASWVENEPFLLRDLMNFDSGCASNLLSDHHVSWIIVCCRDGGTYTSKPLMLWLVTNCDFSRRTAREL
eukprot:COSAG01_NODE_37476_length_503_cov_0.653465_1_plen_146_part_01